MTQDYADRLAAEAWRMLTDDARAAMSSLKGTYLDSLAEDIRHETRAYAIEAIKACAEAADASFEYSNFDDKVIEDSIKVDKQSILNIINELK